MNKNKNWLNAGTICGATLVVLFIIGLSIAIGTRIIKLSTQEDAPLPTSYPPVTDIEEPIPTLAPTPEPFFRVVTYSPSLTYKRMSGIHSSVEATDAEAMQMRDVITSFNNAWIEYINTGDTTVFNYLREGTEAYKNAVKYGSKGILEEYEVMDIRDARKSGSDFYVWDYEVINEYSGTANRKEYHWVYKICRDSGGYYVADYTSDPAYN